MESSGNLRDISLAKIHYVVPTKVKKLEERKAITRSYLKDDKPVFEEHSIGWWISFEGSRESLYMGSTKPEGLEPGTEIEIIIRPKEKSDGKESTG